MNSLKSKLKTPKTKKKPKSGSSAAALVSVCPQGQSFSLPREKDYAGEYKRLERIVAAERKKGREIVVVMGVGFVGAVMAGVVADSVDRKTGKPGKFVIGMQRPSPRSLLEDPLPQPRRRPGGGRGPRGGPADRAAASRRRRP